MARGIIRLQRGDDIRYLEWSSIVDAPVTYGLRLEEFKEYMLEQYGIDGCRNLDERLKRADATGTSYLDGGNLEDQVSYNRAGPEEECLSVDGLWEQYCADQYEA